MSGRARRLDRVHGVRHRGRRRQQVRLALDQRKPGIGQVALGGQQHNDRTEALGRGVEVGGVGLLADREQHLGIVILLLGGDELIVGAPDFGNGTKLPPWRAAAARSASDTRRRPALRGRENACTALCRHFSRLCENERGVLVTSAAMRQWRRKFRPQERHRDPAPAVAASDTWRVCPPPARPCW